MPPVASWGVPAGRVAGSAATGGGPPTGMECCRFFPALCLDFIFSPSHRLSTFIFYCPAPEFSPVSFLCVAFIMPQDPQGYLVGFMWGGMISSVIVF